MGSRRQRIRDSWLGRFVRGRRPDHNPLRRPSDRAETAVLALLVIAFLAAAPFAALAAGGWAHARAHQAQLAQQASWHQVPARVLTVSSGVQGGGGYAMLGVQARARWTAPDGAVVTGQIPVPAGTTAGTTVPLWITGDGQPAAPPLQDAQVADSGYFAGTVSVLALAVILAITGLAARRVLDRHRIAAWDAQWRTTGPRWTTRT